MKPLNAAERNSAFLYFLILFVITTGLIVLAIFFGMQVPFRQNEKLQQQLNQYESQNAFAETFSAKMTDTKLLLDSIPRAGIRTDLLNGQISNNLVMLNGMVESNTIIDKKIYHDIINFLSELQNAKTQLQQAGSNDDAVGKLTQANQDLQNKLENAKADANDWRQQLIANGITPVAGHN